jgi:orotidine-5'-phosphate decarboxylase
MKRSQLIEQIRKKGTFLCVGLDTDPNRIPQHLKQGKDPVFTFNKAIIDATAAHCVAYKPNLAFYEAMGPAGMESLARTVDYIPKDCFTIADAKRGDIGNTAASYAKTFFETYNFDSVTLAPYMGRDSIEPFLAHQGKWSIILALTSNPSADDFEKQELASGRLLFEEVLRQSKQWGSDENIMYVVGATNADALKQVRQIVPNHFILVPGVGAQGGSLEEVAKYGLNSDVGLLVNSSRAILYASSGEDFAEAARAEAANLHQQMKSLLA